jgi:serine/threonine protein kinase
MTPQSPVAARFCSACGAQLNGDVCPKCVLRLGMETQTAPVGWARFVAPSPQSLAGRLPGLEILELLGQGGMGAVYKGRQISLDRLVAIKILPALANADPAFAERFAREARALAKLCHPNIVNVYDFGRTEANDDLVYFVMEYVPGVNLRQMLLAGTLAPADALRIVPQVCEALQYAHDHGIVHRDIKPENILIDTQGRVKIADFGLAKLLAVAPTPADLTLTAENHILGTPRYMAPEQIERPAAVDHRADIYSLGVVLYEMLTGELPLGRFAPPSQKVQVDVRLDEVVLRTLEKEPARRYQHASDVKTDLDSVQFVRDPATAIPGTSQVWSAQETAWLRKPPSQRRAIKAILYAIVIGGMIACFSTNGHGTLTSGHPSAVRLDVGYPDTWFHWSPDGFQFRVFQWSVGIGVIALFCAARLARIIHAEQRARAADNRLAAAAPAATATRPAATAGHVYTLPPGAGPMLMLCAGGMVVGALCMTAGLALAVLAFLRETPGSGPFWGWIGSAFGAFFGGGGALAGSWNSYRQLTGRQDLMSESGWTVLDRALVLYTVLGGLLLAAAAATWRIAGHDTRYALLLLGGMVSVQGALFFIVRAAMRRAAIERQRAPEPPQRHAL